MDTQIRFKSVIYFFVSLVILALPAHAETPMTQLQLAAFFDQVQPRHDVEVMQVTNKDGKIVHVTVPVKDGDKLFKTRPSELRKASAAMRRNIQAQCAAGRNPVAQFALDFVPESAKFYTAIGLSAGDQMNEDPAYARHFVDHSFFDPFGYAGFAGFMIGSRAAGTLLSMTGLTYNPCQLIKKYPKGLPVMKPTRFQRLFSPLAGQIGMIAGLTVNTMVDALRDPNIIKCGALMIGKISGGKEEDEAEKSCDQAYEDWVMNGGKLRDMVPDIASMTTVGLALASPQIAMTASEEGLEYLGKQKLEQAAGGVTLRFAVKKATNTILYRGFTMVLRVGSVVGGTLGQMSSIPLVRVAFEVGNMWAFFHFNDKLKPLINTPWQTVWQGRDIEKTREHIVNIFALSKASGWEPPRTSGRAVCFTDSKNIPGKVAAVHCVTELEKTAESIALLGRQEAKWRSFLMADPMAAVSNWQNYVLEFTNMYTSAKKLYTDILKRVDYHSTPEGKSFLDPMYEKVPLYGMPLDLEHWSGKMCELPPQNQKVFDQAASVIRAAIGEEGRHSIELPQLSPSNLKKGWSPKITSTVHRAAHGAKVTLYGIDPDLHMSQGGRFAVGEPSHYDIATLKQVLDGMDAMNCKTTPALTDAQRSQKVERAIEIIYWQLQSGPHQAWGADFNTPDYVSMTKSNLYMKLHYMLGFPEAMVAGNGYVRQLNKNPDFINQDYKDLHPDHLGSVKTLQMTDYLLTAMVCGPDATPTTKVKIIAANEEKMGWWARTKAIARGDWQAPNPYTANDMLSVEKYYQSHLAPEPSLANLGGLLKSDIAITSETASWQATFRPPRIVKDLGFNPCGQMGPVSHQTKIVSTFDGSASADIVNPYFTVWTINKSKFAGLLSIVKSFARADVLGTKQFEDWWTLNVESHVQKVVDVYRLSFIDILNKKYVPVLTNENRSKINGRPFGVIRSLADSAQGTIALLVPLVDVGPKGSEAKAEMQKLSALFMNRLRIQLMMIGPIGTMRTGLQSIADGLMPEQRAARHLRPPLTVLDGRSQNVSKRDDEIETFVGQDAAFQAVFNAYEFNEKELNNVMNKMAQLASDQSKLVRSPSAQQNLQQISKALFENLVGVVTEIDSYHGVNNSIRLNNAAK
jgi:hypothetical protein